MHSATTFQHLRLVRARALHEYIANTKLWFQIGNAAFAERIAAAPKSLSDVLTRPERSSAKPFILYHSWKPGAVELTARQAAEVRKMVRTRPDVRAPVSDLERRIAALGWCETSEPPISALVERCRDTFIAVQNFKEFAQLLRMVRKLKPEVIVEIGSARGGTMYAFSQIAHPRAHIVSIDLPGAPNCGGQTAVERRVFRSFARPRQCMSFLARDSHLRSTLRSLKYALDGHGIDLLFIDGDHSYNGVRADFEMYSGLVSMRGMIVFHDILLYEKNWGPESAAGDFWNEIKKYHSFTEIVDRTGVTTTTLSEGEHWAWGIGVLSHFAARQRP